MLVELVELSLALEALDAELSVEAVLVELDESTACSASSRVCRSLLSLEAELEGGGGGGGGGPPAGGGPLGGAESLEESLPELTAETEETEAAVDVVLVAWPPAASNCCKSCHPDEALDEPMEPIDIADALLGRL